MTAKLYNLSKDILKIIDEYSHDEINYHDLLKWVKNHPCLTNNYCSRREYKMISDLYQMIKMEKNKKGGLMNYRQKIRRQYRQEKYSETT